MGLPWVSETRAICQGPVRSLGSLKFVCRHDEAFVPTLRPIFDFDPETAVVAIAYARLLETPDQRSMGQSLALGAFGVEALGQCYVR